MSRHEAARWRLDDALNDGRPLSPEVRFHLRALLSALSISSDPRFAPTHPPTSWEAERDAAPWLASAWAQAVDRYESLLDAVAAPPATVAPAGRTDV